MFLKVLAKLHLQRQGTNQYEFSLTMVVCPEEFGKETLWHIEQVTNELSLYYFFCGNQKRCSKELAVSALMTHDDNSGWKSYNFSFGGSTQHIL